MKLLFGDRWARYENSLPATVLVAMKPWSGLGRLPVHSAPGLGDLRLGRTCSESAPGRCRTPNGCWRDSLFQTYCEQYCEHNMPMHLDPSKCCFPTSSLDSLAWPSEIRRHLTKLNILGSRMNQNEQCHPWACETDSMAIWPWLGLWLLTREVFGLDQAKGVAGASGSYRLKYDKTVTDLTGFAGAAWMLADFELHLGEYCRHTYTVQD